MILNNDHCVLGIYLNDKALQNNPHSIEQLKKNITNLLTEEKRVTLKKAGRNVLKRANSCVNANGGPFEDLT